MYVYLSPFFFLLFSCACMFFLPLLLLSCSVIPFAMFTFGSDARSLCVVDFFLFLFCSFFGWFSKCAMKCVRDDNGNNNASKSTKKKTTKKEKKNVHFFDTIYGSFGRVRHIFHVKFATHRTESEHVHQIFYSMIPFAFMLVAYCMRFPLCALIISWLMWQQIHTTYLHTHTYYLE